MSGKPTECGFASEDETVDLPTPALPLAEAEVSEAALARLWHKGREAWREIPSAAEWVESLRGNKTPPGLIITER